MAHDDGDGGCVSWVGLGYIGWEGVMVGVWACECVGLELGRLGGGGGVGVDDGIGGDRAR